MEDPQFSLSPSDIRGMQRIASVSSSPEHSRARSKRIHAQHQPPPTGSRPQIRRKESYTDGTRRGRSSTRSVSPESAKRRAVRRRRSRSPSRSCSTSATETQSSGMKRQRKSQDNTVSDEHSKSDAPEALARDESRESMRSRSKRRKKYRRRSDYAAAAADTDEHVDLNSLRGMSSTGATAQNSDIHSNGNPQDRMESFESVLEEDEEADEPASEQ